MPNIKERRSLSE